MIFHISDKSKILILTCFSNVTCQSTGISAYMTTNMNESHCSNGNKSITNLRWDLQSFQVNKASWVIRSTYSALSNLDLHRHQTKSMMFKYLTRGTSQTCRCWTFLHFHHMSITGFGLTSIRQTWTVCWTVTLIPSGWFSACLQFSRYRLLSHCSHLNSHACRGPNLLRLPSGEVMSWCHWRSG